MDCLHHSSVSEEQSKSHVTDILTGGQGYLAGSKSLWSGALEKEKERKRTYRNPTSAGHDENHESRCKQATTERSEAGKV